MRLTGPLVTTMLMEIGAAHSASKCTHDRATETFLPCKPPLLFPSIYLTGRGKTDVDVLDAMIYRENN